MIPPANADTARQVFFNFPIDAEYFPLRDAVLFAVRDCGFHPRCALEKSDSGEVRFQKITRLIRECPLAIHDISRTELDKTTRLPRFNMPFELGVFIGADIFGKPRKQCLILDKTPYRYRKFISDISGNDIAAHNEKPARAVSAARDWLDGYSKNILPDGSVIARRYRRFRRDLPGICQKARIRPHTLTYLSYMALMTQWLDDPDNQLFG